MNNPKLKGTKTIENLMKAFAGESEAVSRYTMFAAKASKEGYALIEHIFLETIENERTHGKEFYKLILDGMEENEIINVRVNAEYPVALGDTLTNLRASVAGEHSEPYIPCADIADAEGFPDIAFKFRKIAAVEAAHERRFLALAEMLENGTLLTKDAPVSWKCSKCGHVHVGNSGPNRCPICGHNQGYFEIDIPQY